MKMGRYTKEPTNAPETRLQRVSRGVLGLLVGLILWSGPARADIDVFTFPGGSTGEVQYNDRGIFEGSSYAVISTTTGKFLIFTPPVGSAADFASYCSSATHIGRVLISSSSTSGQQVYVCESSGSWVQQGGSGSGGSSVYNATATAGFPYGVSVSTLTITSLLSKNCLGTDGSGNVQEGNCGGGGASALEVFSNFDGTRSSPTASIGIGGSLTMTTSGSTATINVSLSSMTANFLTLSSATATYLQTADAGTTYLTKSSATATYLQSLVAASTYLTQSSATATYLQTADASSTYLTKSSATATYLQTETNDGAILNQNTLQAGTTAWPDYLYVHSFGGNPQLLVDGTTAALGSPNGLVEIIADSNHAQLTYNAYGWKVTSAGVTSVGSPNVGISSASPTFPLTVQGSGWFGSSVTANYFSGNGEGLLNVSSLNVVNSNVGSFTNASMTVDAQGRVTAASSGSSGSSVYNATSTAGFPYGFSASTASFASDTLIIASDGRITSTSSPALFSDQAPIQLSGSYADGNAIRITDSDNYPGGGVGILIQTKDSGGGTDTHYFQVSNTGTEARTIMRANDAGVTIEDQYGASTVEMNISDPYNSKTKIIVDSTNDGELYWDSPNNMWISSDTILMNGSKSILFGDADSSNYVGFRSSETLAYNQKYVLFETTGTVDQVAAIKSVNADGTVSLYWKTDSNSGGGGGTTMWIQEGGSDVVQTSTITFNSDQYSVTDLSGKASVVIDTNTAGGIMAYSTGTNSAGQLVRTDASNIISAVQVSSISLPAFFSDPTVRSNLGLAIGTNVQAYDADLDDLADGSLTGSKVGSGVPAANIANGSLGSGVVASSFTPSGVTAGSYGTATQVASFTVTAQGIVTNVQNITITPAASSITGTIQPSQMVSTVAYTNDNSTFTYTMVVSSPSAGWDSITIGGHMPSFVLGSTITAVFAETIPSGSTVTFNLNRRSYQSINSAGTSLFSVTYSTANSDGKSIALATSALVPAQNSVVLTTGVNSTAGNPTQLIVHVWGIRKRDAP